MCRNDTRGSRTGASMRRHIAMACIAFAVVMTGTVIGWIISPKLEYVSASGAWAREEDTTRGVAGVYLTISNRTTTSDALVGAFVPPTIAQFVQLPSSAIELSAHGTTRLTPGSAESILIGLTRPIHAGERFPITLEFRFAPQTTVNVTVESNP